MKKFKFILIMTHIFLIKEIISNRKLEEINCKSFNNCFNCSVCGIDLVEKCPCTWKKNSCYEVTYNPVITNWISYYENCEDSSSKQIQKKYCGDIEYSKKKSSISLPEKNGYYGLMNLFCTYTYVNEQKPKTKFNIDIHLNEKYIRGDSKIYIQYIINFINDTYKIKTISRNEKEELSYDKVSNFKFFILSNDLYDDNPFTIQITYSNGFLIDKIYIISVIIILFILIFIIIIYCCTKNYNERYRNILSRNHMVRNPQLNYEEIQRENNKKIISNLLSNPLLLGERIYEKKYEKNGTNCTICLEEFKINTDKISLTPCNHVFHFKCLSDWLNESISNIKCPNCNFDFTLLQYESERNSNDRSTTSNEINSIPHNENHNLNNNDNHHHFRTQFNNYAQISQSNNSNNRRTVNDRYGSENNNINNNNQISNNIQNRIIRDNENNRNIQSIKSIDNLESINI